MKRAAPHNHLKLNRFMALCWPGGSISFADAKPPENLTKNFLRADAANQPPN